jgi:predicted nucleic acid-binding protein
MIGGRGRLEALDAVLLTCDKKLASGTRHRATIEFIATT